MPGADADLGILKSKGIEQTSFGRCGGSLGGGVGIPCLGVANFVGDANKVGKFNGAVRSAQMKAKKFMGEGQIYKPKIFKAKQVYNLHFL